MINEMILHISTRKNLVKISGDDIRTILDKIIELDIWSPAALLDIFKVSLTTYTIAIARNAHSALSDIATAATDMQTISRGVMKQHKMYQESLEHVSEAWNTTAMSIANYMGEIDKRTLQLANLNTTQYTMQTSPSIDSRHIPDSVVGDLVHLKPDTQYVSQHGTLRISDSDNLGFVASTNAGKDFTLVISHIKKIKVIEILMNRDLDKLADQIQKQRQKIINYSALPAPERKALIDCLAISAPICQGQWIESTLLEDYIDPK